MNISFKQLANLITVSRILGVGLIFYWTPFQSTFTQLLTIIIYTIICTTDFLDGWVARRYNIVSELGKVLDPLADKILVLVFLPLVSMKAIAPFPVFLILAREFAIMGIRVFSAKNGIIISANLAGKLKTAFTLPVCGILMARVIPPVESSLPTVLIPFDLLRLWVLSWPTWIINGLIWAMVAITIWSFFDYLIRFMFQRKVIKTGSEEEAKKYLFSFIPNGISLLNLLCGSYAIVLCFQHQNMRLASGLILAGVFLDAIDGKVARLLGVHTQLGEKLDSKADFITFGLAPAGLLFFHLNTTYHAYNGALAILTAIIFYASVHFRLKRFNKGGHQDYFEGLPSPGGASVVAVMIGSNFLYDPHYVLAIAFVMSGLMVSRFLYPHNRVSHQKVLFSYLRKPTLLFWFLTIFYFFGFTLLDPFYIPEILLFLTAFYVISPIIPLKKEYQ